MWTPSIFFFFKQKTAYEIVSGDWSSDVCSSDLHTGRALAQLLRATRAQFPRHEVGKAAGRAGEKLERLHTHALGRGTALSRQVEPLQRSHRQDRSIHVVFSSVYFSSACSDLSRPMPDCLKPPNGTVRSSAS